MIEKFSNEELSQILREIGIDEKAIELSSIRKQCALANEKRSFLKYMENKPINGETIFNAILKIIDSTMNNFKDVDGIHGVRIICKNEIKREELTEYREMFSEIFGIIKRHNRQWKQ